MNKQKMLSIPTYDPDALLDTLIDKRQLKNDAALARTLTVAPPVISKIRSRILHLGPAILVRMNEEFDIGIRDLKACAGIKV